MNEKAWQIFRCQPALTLWLVDRLRSLGVNAYTPETSIRRRVPRTKRFEVKRIPMMPSFIFIETVGQFVIAGSNAISRKLRPMIVNGKIAKATGWEIEDMRGHLGVNEFLRANPRKDPALTISVGDRVTLAAGPLRGVEGTVTARSSTYTSFDTNSFLGVLRVHTYLLRKVRREDVA